MNAETETPETTTAQELARVKKRLDGLLRAAEKLDARGFFEHASCADKATLADLRAMRRAIKAVKDGAP